MSATMGAAEQIKPGELVTIRWPEGQHDFVIEFGRVSAPELAGWEDWVILHGVVVEPDDPRHRAFRGFCPRQIGDREFTMLPKVER